MDARDLPFAHGADFHAVGGRLFAALHAVRRVGDARGVVHPPPLGVEVLDDPFGQRDGRTARGVLLLRMVHLPDAYVVAADTVHHLREAAVEAEHQIHAQAVVRGVEQRPAPFAAQRLQFGQSVGPARRAAHDRHAAFDAGADIPVGGRRSGELQRHVDSTQVLRIEFGGVLRVDDERGLVAPFVQDPFDFTAHLAVSYDGCFHVSLVFISARTYGPAPLRDAFRSAAVYPHAKIRIYLNFERRGGRLWYVCGAMPEMRRKMRRRGFCGADRNFSYLCLRHPDGAAFRRERAGIRFPAPYPDRAGS